MNSVVQHAPPTPRAVARELDADLNGIGLQVTELPGDKFQLVTPDGVSTAPPVSAYDFLTLVGYLRLGVELCRHALTRCAWGGCTKDRKGRSKYCAEHYEVADDTFRRMVDIQEKQRKARFEEYQGTCERAAAAGEAAASALKDDGSSGRAWVHVLGANKAFPRWSKDHGYSQTEPNRRVGGVRFDAPAALSYTQQEAWARAHAQVLKDDGVADVNVVTRRQL